MDRNPAWQGEQQVYTVNEACALLRIGRTKIYELMSEGRLPFAMLDGRRRVFVDDARQLLIEQASQPIGETEPRGREDKDDAARRSSAKPGGIPPRPATGKFPDAAEVLRVIPGSMMMPLKWMLPIRPDVSFRLKADAVFSAVLSLLTIAPPNATGNV